MKPGELDLWATETLEKVNEGLYAQLPDQIPHPVICYFYLVLLYSSGKLMLERSLKTMNQRDFLLVPVRCIFGSVLRKWKKVSGKVLFNAIIYLLLFVETNISSNSKQLHLRRYIRILISWLLCIHICILIIVILKITI